MSYELVFDEVRQRDWQPITLAQPIPVDNLPTPALMLNRAAFERNLANMAAHLERHHKGMRPHTKTHKCPEIARQQLAAGAVGLCVAKLGEAVAMVSAGIHNLLITSPLTQAAKLHVLNDIIKQSADIKLVLDSEFGWAQLDAAISPDARLGLVLDVDVEMGRSGQREPEVLKRLAELVDQDPRFYLAGVQHYAGHLMHVTDFAQRQQRSLESWHMALGKLESAGIDLNGLIVSGGGTGTFDIDVAVAAVTDLQVGSFIFMDREYLMVEGPTGAGMDAFESSLQMACSVISSPQAQAVTVDGGYKSFASETVAPQPLDVADAKFRFAGDEHGVMRLKSGTQQPILGSVQTFLIPHCDPTVNLHDRYWVVEDDGLVHSVWPITARGCAW